MKPLAELLTQYLHYGRSLQASRHTLRAIRYHGQAFLNWLEATHHVQRVDHLRPEHLEGWMKHLAGRHTQQGFPLKSRTINKLVENLRTFRRIVHRSAEAAELEINVTPHTFRRSCTTELIRGGANQYHVQELLGHENLETLNHYSKLTIEDLKATHARCHPRERNEAG